jgi:phage FluMu protein Com
MVKILEIAPEIEATLRQGECPKCGFVNNIEVAEIHHYADSGVMNGVPYQVVEVKTISCQNCGQKYTRKSYI